MARTQVDEPQIEDGAVTRDKLNVATASKAVTRKIIQGTGISLSSTGADAGTGDVTVNATGSGTLYDAKGNILIGSGDNAAGVLPVGPDGHVLTADSVETLGVKWAEGGGGGPHTHSSDALTPESVEITGGPFALRGDITPAVLASSVNNYDPSGLSDATVLRLDAPNNVVNITGLAGGQDGRIVVLVNIGTFAITLVTQSGSSTASNRFALDSNLILDVNTSATLIYDSTSSRWRLAGRGKSASDAPTSVNYLVGTASDDLSSEIVVGTSPGGELGGSWASPTVDATHAGSTHSAATDTHIADTSDAHDASAISIVDAGGDFTATDVEGALDELQADNEAHVAASHPHTVYVRESQFGADFNMSGTFASRPAASLAGRLYFATDREELFRDTGSAWVLVTGQIVLARVIYNPGTVNDIAITSTTFVDADATNLAITFTAPTSGKVVVQLDAAGKVSGTSVAHYWCLREGTNNITDTPQLAFRGGSTTAIGRPFYQTLVTGLTGGTSYTYKWGIRTNSGTATLSCGGNPTSNANDGGPAIMTVLGVVR